MNLSFKPLRAGLVLAAFLPFAAGVLLGDDIPQQAPPPQAPPPQAASPQVQAQQAPTKAPETPLHEIGAPSAVAPAPAVAAPASAAQAAPTQAAERPERDEGDRDHDRNDDNRVTVGDSTYVGPSERVYGNAVAVLGPTTVDGTVDGNAAAIVGRNTVNGTVHGNAVAVLGNLTLGPKARVDGNAVSVGGRVIKDPTATVGGNVVPVNIGMDISGNDAASSFWNHGLKLGRPMAFGPHLHLFWMANLCLIAFYMLLVLVFPGGVAKCADTLEQRPGITFLTGFLAMLGMPVLFILLLVTVVGIPVALVVLPLSVIACIMFGKASLYAFIGRSIVGRQAHLTLCAIVGILVTLVLYFIPVLGLALWFLVAFVGFSCALTALFTSGGRPAPAGTPPAAGMPGVAAAPSAPAPAAGAPAAAAGAAVVSESPVVPPAGVEPPALAVAVPAAAPAPLPPALAVSEAALPRAGFWIRMAALFIDFVLVAIVFHLPVLFMPALAAYGAILWKVRGSTVGGIIFSLKVVRADGRHSDWATVWVRALACFLSLVVLGLGFIWIAFDPEKQGWHDKIAGTVVVRVPKGVSLV